MPTRHLTDDQRRGFAVDSLKAKLDEMEARLTQVDHDLKAPEPSPVRFHPNLADLYRQKVMDLAATLSDPDIRTQAIETIQSLISSVTVSIGTDGVKIELEGAITMMIGVAQNAKSPLGSGLDADIVHRSVKVVAGARLGHCFAKMTNVRIAR